jgi:2-polyprenyl-3-methyl-5-hydroxy-6-metoxy-1,4-benzoquinol methylase
MSRDIDQETLDRIAAKSPYKDVLLKMVDVSRKRFGWYTKQLTRSLEYPWIATQLGDVRGKSVVDVGAGCSPLPLYLANAGAKVTTIDYSVAVPEGRPASEWGFLDYRTLDPTITSLNSDAAGVSLSGIDAVYSVSAMEHMPAAIRRSVLRRASEWLNVGGKLLLTLDIVPGSDDLWNRDRGKDVEDPAIHGTVEGLVGELQNVGMRVDEIVRTPVNIVMITGTRLNR